MTLREDEPRRILLPLGGPTKLLGPNLEELPPSQQALDAARSEEKRLAMDRVFGNTKYPAAHQGQRERQRRRRHMRQEGE